MAPDLPNSRAAITSSGGRSGVERSSILGARLVPELATSWTASPDATVFTFDLRKGVTFQDGTPFNAQAVKTYFDWVIDPANHFVRQSLYNVIKSIDVVSEYQVKFTLSKPFGAML